MRGRPMVGWPQVTHPLTRSNRKDMSAIARRILVQVVVTIECDPSDNAEHYAKVLAQEAINGRAPGYSEAEAKVVGTLELYPCCDAKTFGEHAENRNEGTCRATTLETTRMRAANPALGRREGAAFNRSRF